MAKFNSYDAPSGQYARLYSPTMDLTGAEVAECRFWFHRHSSSSSNDRVYFRVSTDNGDTWTSLAEFKRYGSTTGWEEKVVPLGYYTNQSSIRIALRGVSSYGYNIYVDDLRVTKDNLAAGVEAAALPSLLPLTIVPGRAHQVLCAADVALCKPGTSTLEAALLGCPLVAAARTTWLTSVLVRRLVRVDTLVMPNLIAGEAVVPEFYQQDADPERIAAALFELLAGPARERQLERFERVRETLSRGGAARRAAEIAAEMIVARLPA